MTAYSPILTPLNTISTYSGSVAQLLAQVEARPQDFCLTTSWASHSSTPSDGIYLTGVSLIRREPNCPISTLTLHHQSDPQSLKQFVKSVESLDSFRSQLSEQKERNQLYSRLAAVIEARITQMESMSIKPNICPPSFPKSEDSYGASMMSYMETKKKIESPWLRSFER